MFNEEILKKVLKSGELNMVWNYKHKKFDFIPCYKPIVAEPKCTKIKWYFGKYKNDDCYVFVFHVIVNGQDFGSVIPVDKDISNSEDFMKYFVSAFEYFEQQYETTIREIS